MPARPRHDEAAHSIGRMTRFALALWFLVAMAAQTALPPTYAGHAALYGAHSGAPTHPHLLFSPSGLPPLIEQRSFDRDTESEKRGPQPGQAQAGSTDPREARYGLCRAGLDPCRLILVSRPGRAHAPRAPPPTHG